MLCTHIIYAFAGLDNVTYSIKSLDSFLDTEEGGGRGMHNFLQFTFRILIVRFTL